MVLVVGSALDWTLDTPRLASPRVCCIPIRLWGTCEVDRLEVKGGRVEKKEMTSSATFPLFLSFFVSDLATVGIS